ncbi:MAG: hypothetical protein J7M40_08245 [Planctomycetes bacterium]|nr:hypothetical protein [Planctomycetota bacterium]
MSRRTRIIAATVVLCCLFLSQPGVGEQRPHTAVKLTEVQDGPLSETSGIVASRKNPGIIWAHNDSGDAARVYAVDTRGRYLAKCTFGGVGARDCEDIAIGPGSTKGVDYIYLADIGDNSAVRRHVEIYRAVEPTITAHSAMQDVRLRDVETICLRYPDGACDSETLMVDPVTKDLYIISKRHERSRLYRAAWPDDTTRTVTLQYKCSLPWGWATGGDISRDGTAVIVRNNYTASLWKRRPGSALDEAFDGPAEHVMLAWEPQGEAICFDATSKGYYTTSEGYRPVIYQYLRPAPTISTGKTIFGDDFEGYVDTADLLSGSGNSLNGWTAGGDGIVSLIRSAARSGKHAVGIRLANTNQNRTAAVHYARAIADTQSVGAMSVDGFVAFDRIAGCRVLFQSELHISVDGPDDEASRRIAAVRYDGPSKTWQYQGPQGVYHALSTSRSYRQGRDIWRHFKLATDFETGKYISFQFDDETWFFDADLNSEKATGDKQATWRFGISVIAYAASEQENTTVIVDDIRVRHED